jgi:catechol 2,3-dioxygenase-like lactoylglutathione lyase family enzyme
VLEIDHVILGVRDLDAATRRVEALGLIVVDGGRHEGLGTANRIVPLGTQYLELLGVVNGEEAARHPFGQALLHGIAGGDRLVRWCLQAPDLDAVARRLGLTTEPRSRLRPDGIRLSWRAAGLALSLAEPWLPFFVAWDDLELHPGRAVAEHRVGARGISRIELATRDRPRLERWLAGTRADVRVLGGTPGLRRVVLATREGELALD